MEKVKGIEGYMRLFKEADDDYRLQFVFDTNKKDEWDYIYEMAFKKEKLKEIKDAIDKLP